MAKDKKKKKKKAKKETAREAARRLQEGFDKDKSGGSDQYFSWQKGKNKRRILPAAEVDDPPWLEFDTHFNLGPDGTKAVRCVEPGGALGHPRDKRTEAKVCPPCKEFVKLKMKAWKYPKGNEKGLELWEEAKPYRGRRQFAVNAYDPSDDAKVVKVQKFGQAVMKPLMLIYHDEEEYGDFTDLKTGRVIIVTQTTGKDYTDTEYTVSASTKKSRIKSKVWADLVEELHDLEEAAGKILEPEEIEAIMEGIEEDDDDDLDDDDLDDDDDDDLDEDDDDLDDDDEEEEEEEPPKKKKKSSKKKSSKKKRKN